MTNLKTFLCSHCSIKSTKDIATLTSLPRLRTIDLSFNQLGAVKKGAQPDPMAIVNFFAQCSGLTNLNLEGTPVAQQIPDWRMCVVARIPQLEVLDGHPITEADRRGANMWAKDITSSFGLPVWQWKFTANV